MDVICKNCGKIFTKTKDLRKYCSRECNPRTKLSVHPEKNCIRCGKSFVSKTSLNVYCSIDCHVYEAVDRRRARHYDLTLEQVRELPTVCEICGRAEDITCTKRVFRLAIDHDEKTGRARGSLCGRHNRGLGMFDHDPELLRAAIRYLESHDRHPIPAQA